MFITIRVRESVFTSVLTFWPLCFHPGVPNFFDTAEVAAATFINFVSMVVSVILAIHCQSPDETVDLWQDDFSHVPLEIVQQLCRAALRAVALGIKHRLLEALQKRVVNSRRVVLVLQVAFRIVANETLLVPFRVTGAIWRIRVRMVATVERCA